MDLTQIFIILSLITVTTIIFFVGIWLVRLLKELTKTVKNINTVVDDAKMLSTSIAQPVSALSEFIMGFKNTFQIVNQFQEVIQTWFQKRADKKQENKESEEVIDQEPLIVSQSEPEEKAKPKKAKTFFKSKK